MKGRPPVPTALKILRGNPGKRPLNKNEPQPEVEIPDCPPHLDEEAKAEWERLAAELAALGILTNIDRGVLATYCLSWSRWVKAELMVQKTGEILKSKDGGLYQNPYLAVANRAKDDLRAIGALLGLNPCDRVRLHVEKKEKKGLATRARA